MIAIWKSSFKCNSTRIDTAYYISGRVINCFRIETRKYLTKRSRALNPRYPRGCLAIPRVSIRQKLENFQSSYRRYLVLVSDQSVYRRNEGKVNQMTTTSQRPTQEDKQREIKNFAYRRIHSAKVMKRDCSFLKVANSEREEVWKIHEVALGVTFDAE